MKLHINNDGKIYYESSLSFPIVFLLIGVIVIFCLCLPITSEAIYYIKIIAIIYLAIAIILGLIQRLSNS